MKKILIFMFMLISVSAFSQGFPKTTRPDTLTQAFTVFQTQYGTFGVWLDSLLSAGVGSGGTTDLSTGTRTSTTFPINNSNGTGVTIDNATIEGGTNVAGLMTPIEKGQMTQQTIAYSATISANLNNGNRIYVDMTGDAAIAAPSNSVAGEEITYILTANGANRTATFASVVFKEEDGVTDVGAEVITSGSTKAFTFKVGPTVLHRIGGGADGATIETNTVPSGGKAGDMAVHTNLGQFYIHDGIAYNTQGFPDGDFAKTASLTTNADLTPNLSTGLRYTWSINGNYNLQNPTFGSIGRKGVIAVTNTAGTASTITTVGGNYVDENYATVSTIVIPASATKYLTFRQATDSGGPVVMLENVTIINPTMGGDLSGTASNAQIVANAVGPNEIATGGVELNTGDVTGTLPTTKGGTGLTSLGSALQVLRVNAGGTALEYAAASGGGTPGGSNTQIQYNNSGSFAGASGITTNGTDLTTTGTLTNTYSTTLGSGFSSVSNITGTLNVTTNTASPSGLYYGLRQTTNVLGTVANSATAYGAYYQVYNQLTSQTLNKVYGFLARAGATGSVTNTTTDVVGVAGGLDAFGSSASFLKTISSVRGISSELTGNFQNANVTNYYGLYSGNITAGTGSSLTNLYGLYLENITGGATTNYAIYSAGGNSYLAGNLGLATLSPAEKLDVTGNIRTSGQYQIGGTANYMNSPTTNTLALFTNSTERLRVNASGNVGIGTSTQVNRLDVEGALAVGVNYSGTTVAPTNGAIIEGSTGIGVNSVVASSILDIGGTTKGSRPFPSLTTTQRDAIASPATGLFTYNTTNNRLEFYNGSAWGGVNTNLFSGALTNTAFVSHTDNFGFEMTGTGAKRLYTTNGTYNNSLIVNSTGSFLSSTDGTNTSNINILANGNAVINSSTGNYLISTAPQKNSDVAGDLQVRDGSGFLKAVDREAFEVLTGSGAPVNGTTTAYEVGQIYIDVTNAANPISYYASVKSTDPDAAATGSVWNRLTNSTTLSDADGDTKVQVEESTDEDIIRFDAGGNEVALFYNTRIDFNRRHSIFGSGALNAGSAAQTTLTNTSALQTMQWHLDDDGHLNLYDSSVRRLVIPNNGILEESATKALYMDAQDSLVYLNTSGTWTPTLTLTGTDTVVINHGGTWSRSGNTVTYSLSFAVGLPSTAQSNLHGVQFTLPVSSTLTSHQIKGTTSMIETGDGSNIAFTAGDDLTFQAVVAAVSNDGYLSYSVTRPTGNFNAGNNRFWITITGNYTVN